MAWPLLSRQLLKNRHFTHCRFIPPAIYAKDVRDVMHTRTQELLLLLRKHGGGWSRGGVIIGSNKRLYISTGDGSFDPANYDYGSSLS